MTSSSHSKSNPLILVLSLSVLFFIIFIGASGLIFFSQKKGISHSRGSALSNDAVAVVELNGVIMDSKKILRRLEAFEDVKEIKAVVLRLNSPGGSVAPSQEIYEAVKKYPKPVVVSMASVAASGAYYISCGAKKVFANAGTITGSIGVIMEFINLEKLYDWAKVKRYSIKTGRFKDAGAEYREMSADEKALLQGMVDDVLLQFKTAVADGRKLTMEQVSAVADGRIFSGAQAKKAKLVDELGTLDDAIAEAGKMGGISGKPRVVYPDKRMKLLEFLMNDASSDDLDEESISHLNGQGVLERLISRFLGGVQEKAAMKMPGIYWIWSGAR